MEPTPSGWIPTCDCRGLPGGPPALVADTEHVARDVIDPPVKKSEVEASNGMLAPCTPGHFWCDQKSFDWIIVCNSRGTWEKSSYCGKTNQGYGW